MHLLILCALFAILTIAISHREPERPMVAEGIVRQVQPAPTLAPPNSSSAPRN